MQTETVAEEEFILIQENGTEVPFSWKLGMPVRSQQRWVATSYLDGIDLLPTKSYGETAMQALLLAAACGHESLRRIIARGEIVAFRADKDSPLTSDELTYFYYPTTTGVSL